PLLVNVVPFIKNTLLPIFSVVPVLMVMLSVMLLKTAGARNVAECPAEALLRTRLGRTPAMLNAFAAPEAALPNCTVPPVTVVVPVSPDWLRKSRGPETAVLASWQMMVPLVMLVVPTPVPRSKLPSVVDALPIVQTVIVPPV